MPVDSRLPPAGGERAVEADDEAAESCARESNRDTRVIRTAPPSLRTPRPSNPARPDAALRRAANGSAGPPARSRCIEHDEIESVSEGNARPRNPTPNSRFERCDHEHVDTGR